MGILIVLSVAVAGLMFAGCHHSTNPMSDAPTSAPTILAMAPAPGQSYIGIDQVFMVEFSEPMDVLSVEKAYRLMLGQDVVMGTYTWNTENTLMHFQPRPALAPDTEIQVQWGRGMRSRRGQEVVTESGISMTPFVFQCIVFDEPSNFSSKGERIYFTATSASGAPIAFTMGGDFDGDALPGYGRRSGMGSDMMGGDMMNTAIEGLHGMACVTCHGPDGSGGRYLAMGTIRTPNIQYAVLTGEREPEEESHGEEGEQAHGHASYDDETIKRAIAEGIDPDGQALNAFMPRWSMPEQELDDLWEFLKTL